MHECKRRLPGSAHRTRGRVRAVLALALLGTVGCPGPTVGNIWDDAEDDERDDGDAGDGVADASDDPANDAGWDDADAARDDTPRDGSTVDGGAPAPTADGGLPTAKSEAYCHLEAAQIGWMGDSYLTSSSPLTTALEAQAQRAGALKAGERYLNAARKGATMTAQPSVPGQLAELLREAGARGSRGPRVAIMNGGGNDVLVENRRCLDLRSPVSDAPCMEVVAKTVASMQRTFRAMRAVGIAHVIYVGYPNLPGGGLGGGRPDVLNDYATPLMRDACEGNTDVRCHFVDTRLAFAGQRGYIEPRDRIHPTPEGARAIADLVWRLMVDQCLGSK